MLLITMNSHEVKTRVMGHMIPCQMSKVTSEFDDQIIKLPDNNTNQL